MADRYLLESGSPDGILNEDGSGVLLLEGSESPLKNAARALSFLPRVHLETIAGHAHVGMRTAPAQTIPERFTDDYVRHSGDGDHSREDFLAILLALRQAVPDLTFTIESTIAQADRVAYRWASEGTHHAPYLGVPATERHIRASGITVSRFVGERIAEDWASWNRASLLHSLGIIPLS